MSPSTLTAKPISATGQVSVSLRLKFSASVCGEGLLSSNCCVAFTKSPRNWSIRVWMSLASASVIFWLMMTCWCSSTTCWSWAERIASQASPRLGRKMEARKIQAARRMATSSACAYRHRVARLTLRANRVGATGSINRILRGGLGGDYSYLHISTVRSASGRIVMAKR